MAPTLLRRNDMGGVAMANKAKSEMHVWEITRIRGKAAFYVGTVHPPDEESAITAAIEVYGITDPSEQQRLAARRR
jgi:hypothetical protein